MNAAGENARLDRRLVVRRPHDPVPSHTARQRREQAPAGFVAAGETDERRAAAEACGVVRGVPRAARQHLGRVVLEDQDRRLARDARDAAVDELVGEQIAENDDRGVGEAVDEVKQAPRRRCGKSHAGLKITRESTRPPRSACRTSSLGARRRRASGRPAIGRVRCRTSTVREPTACPSCDVSPLVADDPGPLEIEAERSRSLECHARLRLSAGARPAKTPRARASG